MKKSELKNYIFPAFQARANSISNFKFAKELNKAKTKDLSKK